MANGPFVWFDIAKKKIGDGTFDLDGNTFAAVLVGAADPIAYNFIGASGDCRYADLTAELATANGYTVGGLALTSITFTLSSGDVKFDADDLQWVLTGTITYKYLIIRKVGGNDDLLCFCDANTASGIATASPVAGSLDVQVNAAGIVGWS